MDSPPPQQPVRSIQACLECRKSKLKCDGMTKHDSVCTRCRKRGKTCHWSVHLPFTGAPPFSDGGQTIHDVQASSSVEQTHHESHHVSGLAAAGNENSKAAPGSSSNSSRHPTFYRTSPYEVSSNSSPKLSQTVAQKRSHEHLRGFNTSSSGRRRSRSWSRSPRRTVAKREVSQSPDMLYDEEPFTNPAPLVAIREVALLSPDAEKIDGTSSNERSYDRPASNGHGEQQTGYRAQQESVLAEMNALQSQSGWSKADLTDISAERRHFFERAVAGEPDDIRQLDPLEQGVITMNDAERYFEVYYKSINTQHCLLDPVQDTWQAVRIRSRALFITVVAAAACVDIRQTSISRRAALTHSMDDAIARILMANAKSPDVVKALLLAYLFTQKPDRVSGDKCWLLVDTASRTAAELGLGIRLRTPQASVTNTDTYSFRNAERAWIFSQVMQRSLGTSTGLWAIGKMDVKWDKLEAWCECRDALPGDVPHVAFLFLRRLENHARSQFEDIDAERFSTLDSILASFNALFDNWRQRWVYHPKLAKEHMSRSFLLIVGLHIQLLINVTALKLAEGSRGRRTDFSRDISPDLQPFCTRLAIDLCQTFITNFEGIAHILCRNIVSMVTWSAMALMQMEPDKGRILVTRVALMLAGQAHDREYRTTLSAFFGRSLLSLVNDLTITGTSRRPHHRHVDGTAHHHHHHHKDQLHRQHPTQSTGRDLPGGTRNDDRYINGQAGTQASLIPSSASSARSTTGANSSMHTPASSFFHDGRLMNEAGSDSGGSSAFTANQISAERMLSTMAGPLSADPYNQQWLNQFLDNLAPIAMPEPSLEQRQQTLASNATYMPSSGVPAASNGFDYAPTLSNMSGGGAFNGSLEGNSMFSNNKNFY